MAAARRGHEREVAAGGGPHDADAVRIEAALDGTGADEAYCPLDVLPGRDMLGERRGGTRGAVAHCHDRHTLLVQVAPRRGDFETAGAGAAVAAARPDHLDGARREVRGDVPLHVRHALVRLHARNRGSAPDLDHLVRGARRVGGVAVHERDLGLQFAEKAHLAQELDGAVETVSAVALVGIDVDFGGDLALAQLAVHAGRCERGIDVRPAVQQAHRRGLFVEGEGRIERDVRTIALAYVRAACAVRETVGEREDDGGVHMAWRLVQRVHGRVGGRKRARREKGPQVRSGGHGDGDDLFRVEAAFGGLRAHEADGALPVLPRALVDRKPLGARGAVHQVHALDSKRGQLLAPGVHQPHVAAGLVRPAGDEDDADVGLDVLLRPRARLGRRGFGPFDKRFGVCGTVEAGGAGLVGHRGDLVALAVWHRAFRPKRLALAGNSRKRDADEEGGEDSGHDTGATAKTSGRLTGACVFHGRFPWRIIGGWRLWTRSL